MTLLGSRRFFVADTVADFPNAHTFADAVILEIDTNQIYVSVNGVWTVKWTAGGGGLTVPVVIGDVGNDPTDVPLTVQGADGQTADILKVRTGAMPAFFNTETNGELLFPADMLFTAKTNGTAGNAITVEFVNPGAGQPLAVSVVSDAITVEFETDGGGLSLSTGDDIKAAIEADVTANAMITVEIVGSDGTAVVSFEDTFALAGGLDAGDVFDVGPYGHIETPVVIDQVAGQRAIEIHGADSGNLIRLYDNAGHLRMTMSSFRIDMKDSTETTVLSLSAATGLATESISFGVNGGGVTIIPTDDGSDALYLDGGLLDPVAGAAMVRFVRPIGNMPDAFQSNDAAVIGMELPDAAPVFTMRGQTIGSGFGNTDGNLVGVDIPLFASHHLGTRNLVAPADADLVAGDLTFWFDDTNGAAKLMVKAKQADGAVKTAAVALT